jgi:hypothetical protein
MTADKEPPGNVGRAKFAAERTRLHRDAGKLLIRRDEWGVPDFADRQSPAQKKKRKKFKLTANEGTRNGTWFWLPSEAGHRSIS